MKKQNFLILLCFFLMGYIIPGQAVEYCQPTGSTHEAGNSYVKSITSTGGTVNLNYQTETMPASLLTYVGEASIKQGENLSVHIVANNLGSYSESSVHQDLRYNVAIYFVDWNQDGQFSTSEYAPLAGRTAGEGLHNVGGNANEGYNVLDITHSISIPETASLGKYRVRVIYTNAWEGRASLSQIACGQVKEGVVYDFDVNVVTATPSYPITITEPQNGTLVLKNAAQEIVGNGSEVLAGTELTIEATPASGYEIEFVKVNGNVVFTSSFVVEKATAVSATFIKSLVTNEYPTATFDKPAGFVGKINSAKTTGAVSNLDYTDADGNRSYPRNVVGQFSVLPGTSFTLTYFIKYARWGNVYVYADMAGNGLEFVKYYDSKKDGTPYDQPGKEESIELNVPADLAPGTYRIRLFVTSVNSEAEAKTIGVGGNYSEGGYYDFEYEVLPSYVINIPESEGGSIEIKEGEKVINSGDAVLKNTQLTIEATPAEGYKLVNLFLNNEKLIESSFRVTKASTITAFFTNNYMVTYSSNAGGTVTAYANDRVLESNQPLSIDESLKFVFSLEDNMEIVSALLNDVEIKAQIVNNEYTVGVASADQTLVVTFGEIIPTHEASITIHGSSYGTCAVEIETEEGWLAVTDGMRIKEGASLKIGVSLTDENCELVSLMINGNDFKDDLENNMLLGIVPAEGFELEATFRNTSIPTALYLQPNTNSTKYMFRFDDALLGSHKDRNNTDPSSGYDQDDYRSRNITMSAWLNPQSTAGDLFGYVQKDFYASLGAFKVALNNGNLECDFRYWTGGGNAPGTKNKIISTTGIAADEWAFVTVTIDDANHKIALYKNGEKLGESTLDQYGIGYLMDKSVFFVGNSNMQTNVDNVQVWNRVLTEKEIVGSMAGYVTAPEGLIYNYLFGADNYDSQNKIFANKGRETVVPAATPGAATNVTPGSVVVGSNSNWSSASITDAIFGVGHKLPVYTVTVGEAVGGTFTLKNGDDEVTSGSQLPAGALITIVGNPANGARVDEIRVNGTIIEGDSFNLTEDATVSVKFSTFCILNYSVVGEGQLLVSSYDVPIASGSRVSKYASIDYEMIPAEGYELTSFLFNGAEKIANIENNKFMLALPFDATVVVTFTRKKYTITIPTVENGTISVFDGSNPVTNGQKIDDGTVLNISLLPAEGAELSAFTVNNVNKMSDLQNNRISLTVTDDIVLGASFNKALYTITVVNDNPTFGTLSILDETAGKEYNDGDQIAKGVNLTIRITPKENYKLAHFYENGEEVTDIEEYYISESNQYEYWPAAINSNVSFRTTFSVGSGMGDNKLAEVYYDAVSNRLIMPTGAKASVFALTGESILELAQSAELVGLKKGCYLAKVTTVDKYVILKFVIK